MMHHFMKMTDPWRTSFCAHRNDGPIDEPCDALTVKWLTKTHIWVSVVTNLLLPWRYYASSIWQYMTHPWRTIPGGQEVRLTNDTCINFAYRYFCGFGLGAEICEGLISRISDVVITINRHKLKWKSSRGLTREICENNLTTAKIITYTAVH